jgi:hypothetical protein
MQTEILGYLNLNQVYTNIFSGVNCLKVKNNYIYFKMIVTQQAMSMHTSL